MGVTSVSLFCQLITYPTGKTGACNQCVAMLTCASIRLFVFFPFRHRPPADGQVVGGGVLPGAAQRVSVRRARLLGRPGRGRGAHHHPRLHHVHRDLVQSKQGSGLFNDALNTFCLGLYGVGHLIREREKCFI